MDCNRTRRPRWSFLPLAGGLACALTLGSGCSHPKEVYPVKGQVLLNGKPVPHATLTFVPLDEAGEQAARPFARADGQGNYELSTFNPKDGAPPGRYAVVVEQRKFVSTKEGDQLSDNLLPPRYANPKTSDVQVEVAKASNDLPVKLNR
jgi:hypothetical protein